jgi:hypothetical protein
MALRLLAAPFASEAQQAGKVPHVGLATELVKLNVDHSDCHGALWRSC